MISRLKYPSLFLIGGSLYNLIEILARGYTHWTMTILGGICFILIGLIPKAFPHSPMLVKALIGGMTITLLELISGLIINVLLDWNVWDYSRRFLNFMGQICLRHTLYWCLPTQFGIYLNCYLCYWLFGESKPRHLYILMIKQTLYNVMK